MLKVELLNFNIVDLSFQVNPSCKEEKSVKVALDFSVGSNFNKSKNELEVILGVVYNQKNTPFSFKALCRGIFKLSENPSKDELERLSNINCPAIIFPFLRETIADITRRAGFPSLYLPVTNFVNLRKTLMKKPTQTRTKKITKKKAQKV